MADVFQEVDEIMRQERLQKFWNGYAPWIVTFAVLTIVFTGAFSLYRSWNISVQEKQTGELLAALEKPNFESSATETFADLRPDIKGVALMSAAAKYVATNNSAAALPLYEQVQNDKGIDKDLRALSTLLSVQIKLETETAPDYAVLKEDLEKLWQDKKSPWRYHAHLEAALISSSQQDFDTARSHLKDILGADNLPSSLYEKASALDHIYELRSTSEPKKDVEKTNDEG